MTEAWPFPWKFDRARYADIYMFSCITEADVQAGILELLQTYRVDGVPIDAGGRRQRGRMMGAARAAGVDLAGVQNVKTGRAIPAGFADIEATLAPGGRSLYIEVKAPVWLDSKRKIARAAGRPSPEQLEFLLSKHRRGAIVLVAWSSMDVADYIRAELEINRRALR